MRTKKTERAPAVDFGADEKAMPLQVVKGHAQSVVAPGSSASLIEAISRAAADPKVDIEKMERLYKMAADIRAKEAEAAFNAALARAQAKIEPIATNAYNEQTKSRYAKLSAVCEAIVPLYTAEGLSVSFGTGKAEKEGWYRVEARLSHSAGHHRDYFIDLPPDDSGIKGTTNKTAVHAAGSTNSYARRYLLSMIFNTSTEDDNDGQSGPKGLRMDEGAVADHLAAMEAAADTGSLLRAFKSAYDAATQAKDAEAERLFIRKKNDIRERLGK
jgi:hypothetical protein